MSARALPSAPARRDARPAVRRLAGLAATAALCLAGAARAAAPPLPAVLSVTALPNVAQNPAILGRDGNYSAVINGISYWAFNDTAMRRPNASGQNFIDNSLSVSRSLDATRGIRLAPDQVDSSGLPARFIPFTAQEIAFNAAHDARHCTAATLCGASLAIWPGPIVYDPPSRTVIVPFGEIVRGGGISGFPLVGSGLAVGTVRADGTLDMRRPTQNPGSPMPTLMWGAKEQGYTDSAFIKDGYYYAYAGHGVFVTTQLLLARVPLGQVLHKSAWTYYAGQGVWSADPAAAVRVLDGGAAGSTVFHNDYLGVWMAIYSGNFTNDVYVRVGAAPEGPWSEQKLLFTGQPGAAGTSDYAAHAHPEFSPDGGRTEYVTYVRSTGGFGQALPLVRVEFGPAP